MKNSTIACISSIYEARKEKNEVERGRGECIEGKKKEQGETRGNSLGVKEFSTRG